MVAVIDHVNFQTAIQSGGIEAPTFGNQLLLVDDEQIPTDVRFTLHTQQSWDDDFTIGSVPYDYSSVFFGQAAPKPNQLMVGRWVSANSNPLFVSGPSYEVDFTVWEAISDGSYTVSDGTNSDAITGNDFTGITALSQILAIMNAELTAFGAPTVTGLNTFAWEFDALGRLVLRSSESGASADTIAVITGGGGTDLAAVIMDAANGSSPPGIDAESLEAAAQAITATGPVGADYFNVHQRGGDDDQMQALAAWIETQKKLSDLVLTAVAVKDPGSTTDLAAVLFALGYKRTLGIYTEHTDEYPDAAAAGFFLPLPEGTAQFEWQDLVGISDSGDPTPLDATARAALIAKNCSQIEAIDGVTMLYNGLTFGGEEKRLMLGRDWFDAVNQVDIFNAHIRARGFFFDNDTFADIERGVRKRGKEAQERDILDDTPERPFVVALPDADDIPQSVRDSHTLTEFNLFKGFFKSAIQDYELVGTFSK